MPSTAGIVNSGSRGSRVEIAASDALTTTLSGWTWYGGGFGTKYSAPSTAPDNVASRLVFSKSGNALILNWGTESTRPILRAYAWSSSGYGTKYTDAPSVTQTQVARARRFSADGSAVVYARSASPYIASIDWNDSTGFGTVRTPGTAADWSVVNKVDASSNAVVAAFGETPYINAWAWNAPGFGSKYSNPSTLPPDGLNDAKFSPDGTVVVTCGIGTPRLNAWAFSAGFGTKYSDPATDITGTGTVVNWNSSGNVVAVGHATSPYLSVYAWSAGFGTKYANPSSALPGTVQEVFFTPNSSDIFARTTDNSPYINAYVWSNGFGTKYSDPSGNFSMGSIAVSPVH